MSKGGVVVGLLGGALVVFVLALSDKDGSFRLVSENVYIEHNDSCIPLENFIQTDNPVIEGIASGLATDDFIYAAHQWVSSHVSYPAVGAADWYLPTEVISRQQAGCFGTSVLTASLIRQVLPPDRVYVAIGYCQGSGHAWVMVKNGTWQILETTHADHFEKSGELYKPILMFNDSKILGKPGAVDFLEDYLCNKV